MKFGKYIFFSSVLLLVLLGLLNTSYAQAKEGKNPLMADPTIFFDNGIYYLYGTGGGKEGGGFKVFTSTDGYLWKDEGFALKQGESYGTRGFWAPQVFKHNRKYYMTYTANEHIAIASANHPTGPFKQERLAPIMSSVRIIDPFVWMEPSGGIYLFHVRLDNGNKIFVAPLNDSLNAMDENALKECISATEHWENTKQAAWPVAEGPTVLKHEGWYYMIYSANDFRNPDYAIGYAIAKTPVGPWVKYKGNPIISSKNINAKGTGHGDLFKGKDGEWYYVFHTHHGTEKVSPRKTAIIRLQFVKQKNAPDKIEALPATFNYLTEQDHQ